MTKVGFGEDDGVWRTIGGRKVFIRTGESVSSAMKRSGKFKSAKKNTEIKDEKNEFNNKSKLENAKKNLERIEKELGEYEDNPDMTDSPAHDELKWEYEKAKAEYKKIQDSKKGNERNKYDSEEKYLSNKSDEYYNKLNDKQKEIVDKAKRKGVEAYNKERKDAEELKEKYMNIPEKERVQAYADGKDWKDLVKEKESKLSNTKKTINVPYDALEEVADFDEDTGNYKLKGKYSKLKFEPDYDAEIGDYDDVQPFKIKGDNELIKSFISELGIEDKSTTSSSAYKKAFQEYKKEHPKSKLTLQKFIDMSEGK